MTNKKPGPTTISSFTYTLDATGNRTQMADLSGTHQYQYDALYRLTQVTYPGPQTDTYTYDAVGNRLTKNATAYTYDAADQMVTAGGVTYGYDSNGNQTSRGTDTFAYDHENRLTQSVISGTTSSSTYSGDGLRMTHTVGGQTTSYTWDINAGLPVVLQDGTNTYVYGLDLVSATDGAGAQTYFTYDGLGSTADLTDGTGNVTGGYGYDVFGAVRSQSGGSSNYWLFTGEQTDSDTGLQYLRARFYDPATGRFLSVDPVEAAELYAYVGNNPVNLIDPYGLFGLGSIKKAAGAVAGAAVDVVKAVGPYAAACSPLSPPPLCAATIYTGITGNYVDINLSLGCMGAAGTIGLQYSAWQGFHPYFGTGSSTNFTTCLPSGSVSTSLGQSITPGWNCAAQASAIAPTPWGVGVGGTGQVGKAGVKEGDQFIDFTTGETYYEAGIAIGAPGASAFATCTYVTSLPWLSW